MNFSSQWDHEGQENQDDFFDLYDPNFMSQQYDIVTTADPRHLSANNGSQPAIPPEGTRKRSRERTEEDEEEGLGNEAERITKKAASTGSNVQENRLSQEGQDIWDGQYATSPKQMRKDKLSSWGLSTNEFSSCNDTPEDTRDADVDDAATECTSCSAACASGCGETGEAPICCNDDHCDASPVGDLCVDEGCEGARNPCIDSNCLSDLSLSARTREEAAAAAALATFSNFDDFGTIGSIEGADQFSNFAGNFPVSDEQMHSPVNMGFINDCPTPNMQPSFPPLSYPGANDASDNWLQTLQGFDWLSHLKVYHDPTHHHEGHVRPCPADNPNLVGTQCPLPDPTTSPGDIMSYMSGDMSGFKCGFSAENPDALANHVMTQHWPQLNQLPDPQSHFSTQFLNQYQQGGFSNAQSYTNPSQLAFGPCAGAQQLNKHVGGYGMRQQLGTPASAGRDNSIGSATFPQATPPLTPASSGNLGISPDQLTPSDGTMKSQSLGPQNVYQCFWNDPKTGITCGKNFNDSDGLDTHCKQEHTKSAEKSPGGGFKCMWVTCKRQNDSFSTRAKLNRHLQTHTGYKPMECPICHMRLSAKQALDQHIRTHTNEKPYECKFGCGATFKQHSALTMHHRVHTKEKPLKCDICGAQFTESSNLSKHRRIHSVSGLFRCELCGKSFHRLDQLRRHLGTSHQDQTPDAKEDHMNRARDLAKQERFKRTASNNAQPTAQPNTMPSGLDLLDSYDFNDEPLLVPTKTEDMSL